MFTESKYDYKNSKSYKGVVQSKTKNMDSLYMMLASAEDKTIENYINANISCLNLFHSIKYAEGYIEHIKQHIDESIS